MKLSFYKLIAVLLLLSSTSFAQTPSSNRWKKAVVKIETVLQRYNQQQVDVLLQKQLDSLKKGISQHETFERRDALEAIKDTIRGTGVLVANGTKLYLVTAKHIIKTTEKLLDGSETVSDLFTIMTDANDKKTNDISLQNLFAYNLNARPFVFSDDKTDLAIVSLQKTNYKAIVAYMRANGIMPVPVTAIAQVNDKGEVFTVGFPTLHGSKNADIANGKVVSVNQLGPAFMVNMVVYPGNSGGPIVMNNKLVGILSYQNGFVNNVDAAMRPHEKANTASVIKASNIFCRYYENCR